MGDSDSEDELMSKLTNAGFGRFSGPSENCAYCATPNATLPCTICDEAFYCSEMCKRRHAKQHRAFCISARMKQEQSEEEEEDSSEEESESEDEEVGPPNAPLARGASGKRRNGAKAAGGGGGGGSGGGGIQVPGLTERQIKKLLDLSAKAESMTTSKAVDQLQSQIAQLMSSRALETAAASSRDRGASSASGGVKLKDLKDLQRKLLELEKKTQNISSQPAGTMGMPVTPMTRSIYTPMLVKDDPAFRKYFKLKDMDMPMDQIKAKMSADEVDPALLDTPDAVSPNDPGPAEGAYVPLTVADDPAFKKYFKLKSMSMPVDQIKLKMEAEGLDPDLLDHPNKASPNDPGPPLMAPAPASNMAGFNMSMFAGLGSSAPVVPYVPLLVKNDPEFAKYFKLQQMGMPAEQIKLKMSAEKLDPMVLDRPDDVSPNDPGPPAASAASSTGPVSMEQLFGILMQHQQIIQQVSSSGGGGFGGGGGGGGGGRGSFAGGAAPPRSVEDQMAMELAAAEHAIDDIFGEEQSQTKGPGGMSMIEQLEKKARKESNKKIVERRDEVNQLVSELLAKELSSDQQAIAFYNEICPKLEDIGLSLGVDSVQTWSARLLIKNKDTRDWYFSEQERLDAGQAYGRLWALSFLDRDAGQLISKRSQILNAPTTMRANVKNKAEMIDKFTQLLKDTVKLKHKVFKNGLYAAELRRLHEFSIPERFEERGVELIDASSVLADAAMDLADEELRLLAATTRAKKIRAHTVVHIADKAVQLVGIVKKLGANGVDEDRARGIEQKTKQVKEEFLSGETEEQEEDDVL